MDSTTAVAAPRAGMIDRETETAELTGLLRRRGPMLALLYGRRRVGKTFLINHVWPDAQTFYYAASDATTEFNRRDLLAELARWLGEELNPDDYPTWRTIFRLLLQVRAPDPVVVILDEYQYLRTVVEDVDSQLSAVWEEYKNRGRSRDRFVLVLCGSIVEIMERLDAAGSPLYGRIDWKHRLQPFDYWNAGLMAPFPDPADRARAYGVFGGTPRYLASVDVERSLGENVASAALAPRGDVRAQVETVIEQEKGLRNIAQYRSVLAAIGHGATETNEIAQKTGLKNDNSLRRMLEVLEGLGYIETRRNFAAAFNEPNRYRVADPALRFYYGVVWRYRNELETNPALAVWDAYVKDELPTYMGLVFEDIVCQAYARLRAGQRLPMIHEWGRWEGVDRDRKPVEIDVVARLTDGPMLTGSVKFRGKRFGIAEHRKHLDGLRRLAESGKRWAHEALDPGSPLLYASANGFMPDFDRRIEEEEEGRRVIAWSLEDLYAGSMENT
ncbi:MAG TPA: ATP-binding protein [Longimicrobium sp.]|nr:ATP-binding protein [Longimicrobium sp.]